MVVGVNFSVDVVRSGFQLSLDPVTGAARFDAVDAVAAPIWSGTLLPALVLADETGTRSTHYATGTLMPGDGEFAIDLDYGAAGSGRSRWRELEAGLELFDLELDLAGGLRLVDLFLGLSPLDAQHRSVVPDRDYPEWPDWRAAGFCVPSARPAPAASFLRTFDLGHARVALGHFGPSLGSPYGAAYPRPVYAAAFGDDRGWFLAGIGAEVPDGALTLELRSNSGALRWRYRDDLWSQPEGTRRIRDLARFTWADTGYGAFERYFGTYPPRPRPVTSPSATAAIWNTWGDFRDKRYNIAEQGDAAVALEVDLLAIDDGWETGVSTGIVDETLFPDLDAQVAHLAEQGVKVGFWQAVGWLEDLEGTGLDESDLLHDRDGVPCRANWAMDPHNDARWRWALDPSSPRVRQFVADRTRRIIAQFRPGLLKLDFGYGLPGPDTAAPLDPALRGERLGQIFYRLISDAAHEADPDVAILVYGLHPLYSDLADVISLDDMGDHGDEGEGVGHRHWSVWAALLARRGVAINGSSGYNWEQDGEVLLDSAVLGGTGAVLPLATARDTVPARRLAPRRALNRWHRRTVHWEPLWLDTELGSLHRQPLVRNWGRLEAGRLTALALRGGSPVEGLAFTGAWAVVAQGDADIRGDSGRIAIVPIEPGELSMGGKLFTATAQDLDAGLEGWLFDCDTRTATRFGEPVLAIHATESAESLDRLDQFSRLD